MKRTLGVIFVVIIILGMTSCRLGFANLTDDEARTILTELIPIAEEMNEAFLGKGLESMEYTESEFARTAKYVEVSPQSKYQTVAELSTAAESVFSSEYCKILFESGFVGTDEFTPRYSESADGKLQINVNDKGYELRTKLYPENAVVKHKYEGKTAVSVPAEFDGKPYDNVIIYLVNENGKWLIDSPTY